MAKECIKARDRKKQKLVSKFEEKRAALKKAGDHLGLQKLPRSSSKVRLHNRCLITGRPRGYWRQFGVSRLILREMALNGKIPGMTKASW